MGNLVSSKPSHVGFVYVRVDLLFWLASSSPGTKAATQRFEFWIKDGHIEVQPDNNLRFLNQVKVIYAMDVLVQPSPDWYHTISKPTDRELELVEMFVKKFNPVIPPRINITFWVEREDIYKSYGVPDDDDARAWGVKMAAKYSYLLPSLIIIIRKYRRAMWDAHTTQGDFAEGRKAFPWPDYGASERLTLAPGVSKSVYTFAQWPSHLPTTEYTRDDQPYVRPELGPGIGEQLDISYYTKKYKFDFKTGRFVLRNQTPEERERLAAERARWKDA